MRSRRSLLKWIYAYDLSVAQQEICKWILTLNVLEPSYLGLTWSIPSVFEQDWKNARVTPIYKDDGDINDENNYRPISVIGHFAKMIKSLVSYQIIDFLEEHSFISMDQSAYLKRHSTQTSLHRVIDDWLENVNDGAITGTCLLDISKCFDSINHTILLKKCMVSLAPS